MVSPWRSYQPGPAIPVTNGQLPAVLALPSVVRFTCWVAMSVLENRLQFLIHTELRTPVFKRPDA